MGAQLEPAELLNRIEIWTEEEVRARLARPAAPIAGNIDVRTIDNSGRLEDAGQAFIEIVQSLK